MTAKRPATKHPVAVNKAAEELLPQIRNLIENSRHQAITAANLSMVALYWSAGCVIGTHIQSQPGRAEYGEALLARLGEALNREYGSGFSERNLRDMRRFFDAFNIRQTVSAESTMRHPRSVQMQIKETAGDRIEIEFTRHFHLGWSHYRLLLAQSDSRRRRFY